MNISWDQVKVINGIINYMIPYNELILYAVLNLLFNSVKR